MNLNEIIKLEVEFIYYNNVKSSTDISEALENKPDKWEDDDLFIPTKTNFSANFKSFVITLVSIQITLKWKILCI